jgi:hypothetical protein
MKKEHERPSQLPGDQNTFTFMLLQGQKKEKLQISFPDTRKAQGPFFTPQDIQTLTYM